jgi:methyltransferase (TIGR00027 family)
MIATLTPCDNGSDMEDGGPSVTARRVAAYRLGFDRVATDYGDPAADQALTADVAAGQVAPANRMRDYLAARTAFFDRTVVRVFDRGVRQVVVGAAGYDGRAFRYAKPGVRWFEVDHPATQRDKLARLERLDLAAPHVRFVEADFTRDPVADRLSAAGLRADAPTLFLLEGVAVYLEPAVLEAVLEQFRQVARPGSRLAISMSPSWMRDAAARARFQAAVAALGEPARSAFDPDQAEALLARTGWRITASREEAAAKRERLRSIGLLTASAGPRADVSPTASAGPRPDASAGPPASASAAVRPRHTALREPAQSQPPQSPQSPLPLSALLSQTLVAFTIEFDNEAEHTLPHRTTNYGPGAQGDGVWLVSLAMWENCMRYVADEPITVAELEARARTGTNLDGMRRWGYITIDGTARKIYKGRPRPDAVLRATAAGLRTREVWRPLPGLIEQRWRDRFGPDRVARLRDSLLAVVSQLDPDLPDCLPILGAILLSQGPDPALPPARPADPGTLPLSALLARTLLSFALDYEREAEPSLAVSANLLRVLDADGTRLRELPALTGISKEAVRWVMGVLMRRGLAAEAPDPATRRGKVAKLTPQGLLAQRLYHEFVGTIEQRWHDRFTTGAVGALRASLEALATAPGGGPPPLFEALEPYPDNWRASVPRPVILPHYPMVLHRGGYPDGS